MRERISKKLRRAVAEEARYRCGYCQTQTLLAGMAMQMDHIVPVAEGGSSEKSNLWLACSTCNQKKGAKLTGIDSLSGEEVPLFNPRQQGWSSHFTRSEDGLYIIGLTPTGRATVETLQMNNSLIVQSRHVWVSIGLHPPT